jgi:TfoX/Sxy family transcriptional regulator of competence genes
LKELRERFEEIVLALPDVTKKMMFGSPSYSRGKKLFAMLVTWGIILAGLDGDTREALLKGPSAGYFVGHGRVIKKWIHIRIRDISEIDRYIPFIEASYNSAAG